MIPTLFSFEHPPANPLLPLPTQIALIKVPADPPIAQPKGLVGSHIPWPLCSIYPLITPLRDHFLLWGSNSFLLSFPMSPAAVLCLWIFLIMQLECPGLVLGPTSTYTVAKFRHHRYELEISSELEIMCHTVSLTPPGSQAQS
jgi:hypothetical protein